MIKGQQAATRHRDAGGLTSFLQVGDTERQSHPFSPLKASSHHLRLAVPLCFPPVGFRERQGKSGKYLQTSLPRYWDTLAGEKRTLKACVLPASIAPARGSTLMAASCCLTGSSAEKLPG